MNWIILATMVAFFYGAYNVAIKLASDNIHQVLGAVILQAVAVLVGGGIIGLAKNWWPKFSCI